MFEGLSDKLSNILNTLTRRGALTEEDVNAALREVRRALLEADVALEVVRSFTDKVRARAVGAEVVKSVSPGQQVVKIVHDQLVEMLGSDAEVISLNAVPPVGILMVGLQGSGKTTTTAKIAKRLADREKRRVLMASLDTRRPAAMEQLAVLGRQVGVDTLPIIAGQSAVQIARRAMEAGRLGGYDVVMLDTAGRVTANKAIGTERGTHPMKFFFSAATGEGEHSAKAVRYRIRQLVESESPTAVLSDEAIARKLKSEGIQVARRTVAKYREALRISPSAHRHREHKSKA